MNDDDLPAGGQVSPYVLPADLSAVDQHLHARLVTHQHLPGPGQHAGFIAPGVPIDQGKRAVVGVERNDRFGERFVKRFVGRFVVGGLSRPPHPTAGCDAQQGEPATHPGARLAQQAHHAAGRAAVDDHQVLFRGHAGEFDQQRVYLSADRGVFGGVKNSGPPHDDDRTVHSRQVKLLGQRFQVRAARDEHRLGLLAVFKRDRER